MSAAAGFSYTSQSNCHAAARCIGYHLLHQRFKPLDQDTQLRQLHEQEGRDIEQNLSVLYGGEHGFISGSRSQSNCQWYVEYYILVSGLE